jgi:hypothetical protein
MWSIMLALASAQAVDVSVDKQVEVVSIVSYLADLPPYETLPGSSYAQDMRAHFDKYREHQAVREMRRAFRRADVSYDASMSFAVHLTPQYTLIDDLSLLESRWDARLAERVAEPLKSFVEDTNFAGFWEAHEADRHAARDQYRVVVRRADFPTWFSGQFPARKMALHPAMLVWPNNYGVSYAGPDGKPVMSPVVQVSLTPDDTDGSVDTLLVHEYAHGYINPLFDAQERAWLPQARRAFRPVNQQMRGQAYTSVNTYAHETGVRAVQVLYALDQRGPTAACDEARRHADLGFYAVVPMSVTLDAARQQGVLNGEIPRLGLAFEMAKAPPARPINAVLIEALSGALVARQDGPLGRYVSVIGDQFFVPAGASLVDASTLDGMPTTAAVVYGTPESVPGLSDLLIENGWAVGTNRIVGPGGIDVQASALIVALERKNLPPIVAYVAADEMDLIGINSVFHGPTSYVVAQRTADGWNEVEAAASWPECW